MNVNTFASGKSFYRKDASVFFQRDLEFIQSKMYEELLLPLSANKYIPIKSDIDPGIEIYSYEILDGLGSAKIIGNYADDFPMVDVYKEKKSSRFVDIGNGFEVSIQDLRAARYTNTPLQTLKANVALKAQKKRVNDLAFFGDAKAGVQGWLTNTDVNSAPVAGADANARLWANKTPAAILADLNEIVDYIDTASGGNERATHLLLDRPHYNIINETAVNEYTSVTILQSFTKTHDVIVERANELSTAFPGGTSGMIAYRKDVNTFFQLMPLAFELLDPERRNAAYKVLCMSRHGGTIVPVPTSQAFRYGI